MTDLQILMNQLPETAEQLKASFYKLSHKHWFNIENNNDLLNSSNNESLYTFQQELLENILDIHSHENNSNPQLSHLLDQTLKVKSLHAKLHDVTSHKGLYYFHGKSEYFFVGDLHSDSFIIGVLLDKIDFFNRVTKKDDFTIIFLGDYVDRGHNHLKTIQNLMLLKILFPQHIYLLMGNHDIGKIENGEVTLYLRKMEKDLDYFYIYTNALYEKHDSFTDELLKLYLLFMNSLNVAAFVITENCVIKAVHGGIPRPDDTDEFSYIQNLNMLADDSTDPLDFRIRDCIIWSDPSTQEPAPILSGRRFKFYEKQLDNYMSHIGVDVIIRGHQAIENGHSIYFDGKIHTIFSSGKVMSESKNINPDTAYKKVTPKLLYFNGRGSDITAIDIDLLT